MSPHCLPSPAPGQVDKKPTNKPLDWQKYIGKSVQASMEKDAEGLEGSRKLRCSWRSSAGRASSVRGWGQSPRQQRQISWNMGFHSCYLNC